MRTAVKVAFINLMAFGFVLLGAELIFGGWLKGGFDNLNIPHETLHFDASGLYPGGGAVLYKRDRHGLRGPYDSPSTIDILTLGGSTTDQRYLTEGKTWQDELARRFAEAGAPLSVVNAGVDGQSTLGHLYNFDHWFVKIPDLKPRYMLAYIGINDVHVWMEDTADKLIASSPWIRLHHRIKNNSALYNLYKTIKGTLLARRVKLSGESVDYTTAQWTDIAQATDLMTEDKLRRYEVRLRRLVAKIQDFGAQPILVTQRRGDSKIDADGRLWGLIAQPYNGVDEAVALNTINAKTLAVCRDLALVCFDLAAEIDLTQSDFYDRVHTNPAGAQKIGFYLYEKLKPVVTP